jgi:uncharacterized membrane protein YcaP (DUF421 family)
VFDLDFPKLLQTVAGGLLAYVALVALLRVSGKRTLSKWNAFDFVVTVAIGSTLATVLVSGQTSLVQGLVGFGLLVVSQRVVAWLAMRHPRFRHWIKSTPRLLLRDGRIDTGALRAERVTEAEVRAAVRASGHGRLEDVAAVVLETDGSVSVISGPQGACGSALEGVRGIEASDGDRSR